MENGYYWNNRSFFVYPPCAHTFGVAGQVN